MSKNIFICHRPYHILRSCDLISKYGWKQSFNVLFSFDVKIERLHSWQRFDTNKVFYSAFNDVIELSREPDVSIRDVVSYFSYCKKKRSEYGKYVINHTDADNLFFFSDDELDLQILVDLFVRKASKSLSRVLIDEGMVTYSARRHHTSYRRRIYLNIINRLAGFKYFNSSNTYGDSNLYNYSLANNPDKAFFRKPIGQLTPLSENICKSYRDYISKVFTTPQGKPYVIYIGTYEKSSETEIPIILTIGEIAQKNNLDFYIKLHPQQNENLYRPFISDYPFLEKGCPVELFFSKYAVVCGTISSSLYYASIQGYCVIDIFHLFKGKDMRFKGISDEFDWVKIPSVDSIGSLENIIKDFKNKQII